MTIQVTEQQIRAITWTHEYSECVHYHVQPATYFDDPDAGEVPMDSAVSEAYGFSELRGYLDDGTALVLMIDWATSGDTRGSYNDLFDFDAPASSNAEGPEFPVRLQGADVRMVDDDGDAVLAHELYDVLDDIAYDARNVWQSPARETLPTAPTPDDIDISEDTDMETITLIRDNDRDVRFAGEEVARESSHDINGPRNIRWTELVLYRTAGGKWVCHEIGHTRWQGETTRHRVHIAEDDDGLIDSLGTGWLAKDLYEAAGIDATTNIE